MTEAMKNCFYWVFWGILLAGLSVCHAATATKKADEPVAYRREMAKLIGKIKDYGKAACGEGFFVIANGGAGLLEANEFLPETDYRLLLKQLDGVMAESVHYGWAMKMDEPMPAREQRTYHRLLQNGRAAGVAPLVLDYCRQPEHARKAYRSDELRGYLGWVSEDHGLAKLPQGPPLHDNNFSCDHLSEAKNYMVLLNPAAFPSREEYLRGLAASNYDLLIIDAYYGDAPLTRQEVKALQQKPGGGRRLVAAYMSVGEAADYRPYWQADWRNHPPAWLWKKNKKWKGSFRVRYWQEPWQDILMGSPDSYLDILLTAGFDGVFLDTVDVFYYFEQHSK